METEQNKKEKEWKKVIDLADASLASAPLPEIRDSAGRNGLGDKKNEVEIKIPLLRPIKAEPNYSSSSSGNKRPHDSPLNNSSNLSFDEEEKDPVELRPAKAYKYGSGSTSVAPTKEKSIPQSMSDNEEDDEEDGGGSDDIVNVLSDETENEDEPRRDDDDGGKERNGIRNERDSRGCRDSSPGLE